MNGAVRQNIGAVVVQILVQLGNYPETTANGFKWLLVLESGSKWPWCNVVLRGAVGKTIEKSVS
ncbi:hypothetical protein RMR21_006835 [Agrobacterium sp. rho-8.1]|nr:hypothetical protein [Agrobacterium sp. rho-8.1]